jgi:copper(I)-binding protein
MGCLNSMKRVVPSLVFLLFGVVQAQAHSLRVGNLEIVHPAITVPRPHADHTCAHMKISNRGVQTEYFLGARIGIASAAALMQFPEFGSEAILRKKVAIPPGETLDLRKPSWCLALTGIKVSLEPDTGVYPGTLLFERARKVEIEFMIDAENL